MRRPELWAELMALTPHERAELARDLWGSVEQHDLPPLTAEQRRELDRRYGVRSRDASRALKWEDIQARLLARYT